MKHSEGGSPPSAIRWTILVTALWVLNASTLVYWTCSSLGRQVDLSGALTDRITATEDQAKQQQFNLRLLQTVDKRAAAARSLQHRVVFLSGGVILTGAMTIWMLISLNRDLRRRVGYELRSIAELESE